MPRYFNSVYYNDRRALGSRSMESQIHKIRDGLATTWINETLAAIGGYERGGVILNVPYEQRVPAKAELQRELRKEERIRKGLKKGKVSPRAKISELEKIEDLKKVLRKEMKDQEAQFRREERSDEEEIVSECTLKYSMIVQVTRPPIGELRAERENEKRVMENDEDDLPQTKTLPRSYLDPSHGFVEREIVECLSETFIEECDRSKITLRKSVPLEGDLEQYRSVSFGLNNGAPIQLLATGMAQEAGGRVKPPDPDLTIGYLMKVCGGSDLIPQLVVAFGMGGTETLCFAYILSNWRRDLFEELVRSKENRLVMMTFRRPERIPNPFLRFDRSKLDPKIIVDQTVP